MVMLRMLQTGAVHDLDSSSVSLGLGNLHPSQPLQATDEDGAIAKSIVFANTKVGLAPLVPSAHARSSSGLMPVL